MPAGGALAVDRDGFSAAVTEAIHAHPLITVVREEVTGLPPKEWDLAVVATGPLTSAALAEAMGADKKVAGSALDAIAALVAREVAAGGAVTLPGLGKVVCRARPERQVRNPATGETVTKPADKQVKFTIAKALKDSVNA